jgi:Skp family chaperone for outer membrane proteins
VQPPQRMKEVHRMIITRRIAWTLAICVAAVSLATCVWAAAEIKIGIVDTERAYKDAPRIKHYTEDLNKLRQSLATKLDIRSQNMMLDENEIKELIELKTKDNPSDKDKARIKELEDIERARDAELKALQETKEPNEQQKARQKVLSDMQQKSKDTGSALARDYEGQLQSKMQELNTKAENDLREAINKVAQAKAITVVIAKEAVLFGGIDITDEVIAKLE